MATSVTFDPKELEAKVKAMYRSVAENPHGEFHFEMGRAMAERLGYAPADLDRIPKEAIESFAGVGYYFHLADLEPGETVLDLGSGSGMDTFIAALKVGPSGKVVGVDMTDEQRAKAERLRDRDGFKAVTYLKGYIEDVPLPAASVDIVISNGVINLATDKAAVFRETARLLKSGGRLAISDIVTEVQLPETIVCNSTLWAACIGGAAQLDNYRGQIEAAGLKISRSRTIQATSSFPTTHAGPAGSSASRASPCWRRSSKGSGWRTDPVAGDAPSGHVSLAAYLGDEVAVRNDTSNRAFFEEEIRRLLGRLYGVALRLTGNPAEAEDLVSETTIKAWRKLDQLEDRRAFPKWVFRILTNTYISGRRQAQAEPSAVFEEDGEQSFSLFEMLHQPFLLWWSNPEQALLNKLLGEDIEHALDSLPESFRTIVVLVDIEGYAYGEVADSLGVPIGTVRSRLSRARSMLQRALWKHAKAAGLTVETATKEPIHD